MSASFLEMVQTVTATLGFLMTIRAKVTADLNFIAVKRWGRNGSRLMIAQRNVRIERGFLYVQLALALGGLGSLFLAPPPYFWGDDPATPHEVEMARSIGLTRMVMTFSSIVLMVLSYKDWLEDRLPINIVRASDRQSAAKAVEVAESAEDTAEKAHDMVRTMVDKNLEDKNGEIKDS